MHGQLLELFSTETSRISCLLKRGFELLDVRLGCFHGCGYLSLADLFRIIFLMFRQPVFFHIELMHRA
nr:hypothetical protein WG70_04445 [Burkholderia oklahomensis EO147]